jgi:hypothetical protein
MANRPAAPEGPGLQTPLTKFVQHTFTQNVGIALAGLGMFDDALRDDFVGEIIPVCKPKGDAGYFERDADDASGLGIKLNVAV